MIEYINHYTANTADQRMSLPEEVDKKMVVVLKRLIRDATKHKYPEILDGITMDLTKDGELYICTLYARIGEEQVPILATAGCKGKEQYAELNKTVRDLYTAVCHDEYKITPMPPMVVDIIFPTASLRTVRAGTPPFARYSSWREILQAALPRRQETGPIRLFFPSAVRF